MPTGSGYATSSPRYTFCERQIRPFGRVTQVLICAVATDRVGCAISCEHPTAPLPESPPQKRPPGCPDGLFGRKKARDYCTLPVVLPAIAPPMVSLATIDEPLAASTAVMSSVVLTS